MTDTKSLENENCFILVRPLNRLFEKYKNLLSIRFKVSKSGIILRAPSSILAKSP